MNENSPKIVSALMLLVLLVGCRLNPSATVMATPHSTSTLSPTAMPTGASEFTLYPEPDIIVDVQTYGGETNDWGLDILLLNDGGTLVVGRANNSGLSHRIIPGNAQAIRTDADGNVIWERDYGGDVDGRLYCPIQAGDDEYVILGEIAASYAREETDMYLIKIDGDGNEIWSHTYGGRGMDVEGMVRQTSDGGFILVGAWADEFPTGDLYRNNLILIKTDAEGNEIWSRTYGDKILYLGFGVVQTPDGGYALTGWEAKTYDDRDVIIIKTDEMGEVEWSRTWDLDSGEWDGAFDLLLTPDGYVVVAGIRSIINGPRSAILIKVDLDGNEIWVKEYGEEGAGTEFWDIMDDTDGGYVMAGAVIPGRDAVTGQDIRRGLVIKTDADGEVLWQYVFDEDEYKELMFSSAVVLPGSGYVFIGRATGRDERYADMLWLKLTFDD